MYWVKLYFPKLCAASNNAFRQELPHNDCNLLTLRSTYIVFTTGPQRIIAGGIPGCSLYSPARLETIARALLTMFATALALAPLYALDVLSPDRAPTVYLSTLGFPAFCVVCAKASRSQMSVVSVGYLGLQVLAMILDSERKTRTRGSSLCFSFSKSRDWVNL